MKRALPDEPTCPWPINPPGPYTVNVAAADTHEDEQEISPKLAPAQPLPAVIDAALSLAALGTSPEVGVTRRQLQMPSSPSDEVRSHSAPLPRPPAPLAHGFSSTAGQSRVSTARQSRPSDEEQLNSRRQRQLELLEAAYKKVGPHPTDVQIAYISASLAVAPQIVSTWFRRRGREEAIKKGLRSPPASPAPSPAAGRPPPPKKPRCWSEMQPADLRGRVVVFY